MKKTLIVVCSLFSLSAFAAAPVQGDKSAQQWSPEKRMEMHMDRMQKKLDLTDAQKLQVEDILNNANAQRKSLHEQTQKQLNDVLSAEQQAKLKQQREAHRNNMKKAHGKWSKGQKHQKQWNKGDKRQVKPAPAGK